VIIERPACVDCGATPAIVYRTIDGRPRCMRCHVPRKDAQRRAERETRR
jgi:hypothetical protein